MAASGSDIACDTVEPPGLTRPMVHTTEPPPIDPPPIEGPRNLVVCIDGTSNKFGRNSTNVVKLFAKINWDSPQQRGYYSSGLGTCPKALDVVSHLRRSFSDMMEGAFAWNVEEIVQDAYGWLAREYKERDKIYLFGFSRGAYQVRILAGMIYEVGLIQTETGKQIKTAYEHYVAVRSGKLHAKDIATDFKQTFCWKDMKVHFVGVWDTVSSVGIVKEDVFLSSSSSARHARHFRHALALDERRVKFLPEYFYEMNTVTDTKRAYSPQKQMSDIPSDIKEVWFAGSHSDVGGKNQPGKSFHAGNVSLMWMRHEAAQYGLILKPTDIVWTPADLHSGTSDSMSLIWKLVEYLPIKHQVSWCGDGEHIRKPHVSQPRRIIPKQKVHASVLFANTYRPKAVLGEGFVFPAGWPSTHCEELDDNKWEKVLFDDTAVSVLFAHLQSRQGVPLHYLDRLLFVLTFKEGRVRVRGVNGWQGTFQELIERSEGIVKLTAIVAYCEMSIDDDTALSEDVDKRVTPSKNEARKCLKDILSNRSDSNCGRVLALLRPLADHEVLRKSFLTEDVIECFMKLLDLVLGDPRTDFDHVMDALGCLLKHEDLNIPLFERRRSSMLAGNDRSRLTASLHVILPFTRTQIGRTECKDLKPRLYQLARRYQGHVGLLAIEALLELYEVGEGEEQKAQLALAQCLLNNNFRANLAHAFNLNATDDRNLSRDYDGDARSRALCQLFSPEGLDHPDGVQKTLMDQLKLSTATNNAPERTAATLALLQLCENSRLREHLSGAKITDAFIKQLKRRRSSLLGAHALATCLRHKDMRNLILSNPKIPKYIVGMLRSDSFDDAVGQVEGWQVFADLMKTLMEDGDNNLKGQIGTGITKVLEEKLKRGKSRGIRTTLVALEKLRSLGEQTSDPDQVDVWTRSLVDKGVAYLQSEAWKTQKAGIAILSALAQTQHGVDAIKPHIKDMVNRLLPNSHQPKEHSNPTHIQGSQLKPSCMLGLACALRVLSEDATLREETNTGQQLEALQDLWLDGKLIVEDTPSWRVGTPARDDVLEMIDKMIKSVSGDFSEDLGVTSVGRSALPEIHHWGRLAALVRKSVGKVVAPPVNAAVRAVRYTSQQLSHRQITYFLDRLGQVRWQRRAGLT